MFQRRFQNRPVASSMTTATDMHGYVNATDGSDVWYNQSAAYDNETDVSNTTFKHGDPMKAVQVPTAHCTNTRYMTSIITSKIQSTSRLYPICHIWTCTSAAHEYATIDTILCFHSLHVSVMG